MGMRGILTSLDLDRTNSLYDIAPSGGCWVDISRWTSIRHVRESYLWKAIGPMQIVDRWAHVGILQTKQQQPLYSSSSGSWRGASLNRRGPAKMMRSNNVYENCGKRMHEDLEGSWTGISPSRLILRATFDGEFPVYLESCLRHRNWRAAFITLLPSHR